MTAGDKRPSHSPPANENAGSGGLPYVVEIWDLPRAKVEEVMARADTLAVARAIFEAAISENPSRRVVLRQGARVIEDHT